MGDWTVVGFPNWHVSGSRSKRVGEADYWTGTANRLYYLIGGERKPALCIFSYQQEPIKTSHLNAASLIFADAKHGRWQACGGRPQTIGRSIVPNLNKMMMIVEMVMVVDIVMMLMKEWSW